jgi:DinB superfamily
VIARDDRTRQAPVVEHTDQDLRGSRFRRVDLSGSRLHSVMLRNVKITDAWLDNVEISAEIRALTVNGIDVTDYVHERLVERHPELRMLSATDADGLRAAWALIEQQAEATVDRARTLPDDALNESVDGEFSYLQTLRHLVFATDRWITGPVFGDPKPFHPLGYPYDGAGEDETARLDLDARPTLDEVLDLRRERMARVSEVLRGATDDDLRRTVDSPDHGTTSVMHCIQVVLNEEWWHHRYANRDLDLLAGS